MSVIPKGWLRVDHHSRDDAGGDRENESGSCVPSAGGGGRWVIAPRDRSPISPIISCDAGPNSFDSKGTESV